MRGYRFFIEFNSRGDKWKGCDRGTVFALYTGEGVEEERTLSSLRAYPQGLGAILNQENSPVCWCGTSYPYLRDFCKRVSEKRAREVHPALFLRLDEKGA